MMTYEYDRQNSVIHLHASGILVASDPIGYFAEIDKDPDFKSPAEELIYFVGLEDIAWKYTEVYAIRHAFELHNHGQKITSGKFIVDSALSFGMARMVISVFEGIFDNFTIEHRD